MAEDINSEITTISTNTGHLADNQVIRFCYTSTAYEENDYAGVTSFDQTKEQNIPVGTDAYVESDSTFLSKGMRASVSSTPRMLINHMWGRVSYNLNKIIDFFNAFLTSYKRDLAQNCNLYSSTTAYKIGDICFFPVTRTISGVAINTIEFFYRVGKDGIAGAAPIVSGVYDTEAWTLKTNSLAEISPAAIDSTPTTGSSNLITSGAVKTISSALDSEISTRTTADTTLQNNINTEETVRENADNTLQTNINTEKTARENADTEINATFLKTVVEKSRTYSDSGIKNLNSYIVPGIYDCPIPDDVANWSNYPVSAYGLLVVFLSGFFGSDTSHQDVFQIFVDNAGLTYTRKCIYNTVEWTSWRASFTSFAGGISWGDKDYATTDGVYRLSNETNNASFTMLVFGTYTESSTRTVQLLVDFEGNITYRSKTDGTTWTEFKTLYTNQNVGSGWTTALAQAMDSAPVAGSTKGITSGAVYTALRGKEDTLAYDNAPVLNSDRMLTSGSLYAVMCLDRGVGKKHGYYAFQEEPIHHIYNGITTDVFLNKVTTSHVNVHGLFTMSGEQYVPITLTYVSETPSMTLHYVKVSTGVEYDITITPSTTTVITGVISCA